MKSSFAVLVGLFAATISAAPAITTTVTVQLTNDLTGASGTTTVVADGTERSISSLFGNSGIAVNGQVLATSAQLTAFPQGVFCIIQNAGQNVGIFNFKKTFADLDGNPDAAIPQNLSGAILNCQV